ncbi:unnamed protein product [Staurois parvus]|uniref:Uncharacterized protein n=1 Tax=Staurois parvus TaxID=386267 RepID=A0ABN9C247_9NEOB|nr:unnamed protein product [Staurois parvus]
MGTSVPSTVAISSAGGVPLELMAPTSRSTFLCAGGAGFCADPQRHHPHRCESSRGVSNCGPPAVGELQVPSCLCLWESCL